MKHTILIVAALILAACSSQQKRFESIVPGMSSQDVQKSMDTGPTRFDNISGTDYSSWYWGDDYCLLFQGGKVIMKDTAQSGRTVNAGPASYEEKRYAECLAPGQASQAGADRTINVPGIGKVRIPESDLRELQRRAAKQGK